MPYYISPPPMNPLTRLLAALLAVLALVGAFFFGIFVLALVAGLGLVAWLYLSIRMWWIRRQGGFMGAGQAASGDPFRAGGKNRDEQNGDVIEAEYTVVSRKDEES